MTWVRASPEDLQWHYCPASGPIINIVQYVLNIKIRGLSVWSGILETSFPQHLIESPIIMFHQIFSWCTALHYPATRRKETVLQKWSYYRPIIHVFISKVLSLNLSCNTHHLKVFHVISQPFLANTNLCNNFKWVITISFLSIPLRMMNLWLFLKINYLYNYTASFNNVRLKYYMNMDWLWAG